MSRKHIITVFTTGAEDYVYLNYGHGSICDSDKLILIPFAGV
jgi:hypothetical protein